MSEKVENVRTRYA